MTTKSVIASMVLLLITVNFAFAQQPGGAAASHKYRKIFTIVGGAGGAVIGLLMGMSAFDDAINSDRKVTMTVALSGAGGAVGGYFLGRTIDRNRSNKPAKTVPTTKLRFSNYCGNPACIENPHFLSGVNTTSTFPRQLGSLGAAPLPPEHFR